MLWNKNSYHFFALMRLNSCHKLKSLCFLSDKLQVAEYKSVNNIHKHYTQLWQENRIKKCVHLLWKFTRMNGLVMHDNYLQKYVWRSLRNVYLYLLFILQLFISVWKKSKTRLLHLGKDGLPKWGHFIYQ